MDDNSGLSVRTDPAAHLLVAMVDIRGFSAFAHHENDPSAVANYVRATTEHVLTRVRNCRLLVESVIKPLGDGLLFILNLEGQGQSTMASSTDEMLRELVDVSETFPAYLTLHRPPGLSSVPSRLGIGVTFGSLVRLSVQSSSPDVRFDNYVGHSINLAARLQDLARSGGVLVHNEVYEKILKYDPTRSSNFLSLFSQRLEVRLRNIGEAETTAIYTTATTEIPSEYLQATADEARLEEFAKKAQLELRVSYATKRPSDSHLIQVPETTRFILFKSDGTAFLETVPHMVGQKITFKTEAAFTVDGIKLGRGPVTDAIVTGKPVVVAYPVRFDECADDLDSEYWRQTLERFPEAPVETLRSFAMHPTSIMAIPLTESPGGAVSAVAMFDSLDSGVFGEALADEVALKLGVLYGQLFGSSRAEEARVVQL